jgi:hypothetical protein
MDAGRRGATALEPGDLLEAMINEDQGELTKRFVGAVTRSGPIREPQLFSQQTLRQKLFLGSAPFCLSMNPSPPQWTSRCLPAFNTF